MPFYDFKSIEHKYHKQWEQNNLYKVDDSSKKPKYYVLDMFPYPSGTGLHVGHPLGYIASDIIARYKRMKGFNVLHPIGFDSFGLPAEQHAIQTGKHPADTTETNISTYKKQLKSLGLSFDWSREFRTSDKNYYKWTQWIFLQLFNSYYDENENKAKHIDELPIPKNLTNSEIQSYINNHRLVYQDEILVNWCPELGTVLANEEVVNGVSERGGYPVVRKGMRQWMMRITKYAERLLDDLNLLNWPNAIKLSQKNWIGKSKGAEIDYQIDDNKINDIITVYTTRPDTLYGVTYLVLAPEHKLVSKITTSQQTEKIEEYCKQAARKSDLERTELEKIKTGVFTGMYAICPVSNTKIPIWVSDYVLISYGTGAVMAVPAGDQRDFDFATKFKLPIIEVISKNGKQSTELTGAYPGQGVMLNSDVFNGMKSEECFAKIIKLITEKGVGRAKTQYKIRDWVFNRQRYWGEPIPVYHTEDGHVLPAEENELPIELPKVKSYEPTTSGESPLAKENEWVNIIHPKYGKVKRETNTMPQWAGSCWYYLRYIDPHNKIEFASNEKLKLWGSIDLYVGGAEHAVLHLLYSRFWHKILYDLGHINTKEPFTKLINQGMIQGRSSLVYRIKGKNTFVSDGLKSQYQYDTIHVDINLIANDVLDINAFKKSRNDLNDAEFILENGEYKCGVLIEKMSKSLYNVVSPNKLIEKYGADTFRLYEMFLGPIEQSKPWNTAGIEGVFKFLKKFYALFFDENDNYDLKDKNGTAEELKITHQTIKRVCDDIERFSLNTCVSHFMVATNELTKLKSKSKEALLPLVNLIAPFAPFIAEEIWQKSGQKTNILNMEYPQYNPSLVIEKNYEYPISFNGKVRLKINLPLALSKKEIETQVIENMLVINKLQGKTIKKMIIIPNKIVNIVV